MHPAPRFLFSVAIIPLAFVGGRLSGQSIVRDEPVVVAETTLTANAAGTTELRLAPDGPAATRSLGSVGDQVANLHVNVGGAGSFGDLLSLRGLANTPYFSDASVAVYFDDLPLGSAFTYPTMLFGFSSVTVTRGPQLTVGRAAEGGMIALRSAAPTDRSAGELRAGIGNFNAYNGAFAAQSARTAGVDASVSAAFAEREGYIANTQLGTRIDEQDDDAGAARIRLRPTNTSEVTLQVLGVRRRDGSQPLVPLGGPLFSVTRGREGTTNSDFAGGALTLAFDTAVGGLKATTSRTLWTLDPYDNRLVLPPTLDSRLTQSQRAWNEELRLVSPIHAVTSWMLGAWFSDQTTGGDVNRSIPGLFPIEVSNFNLTTHTAALFGEVTFRPAEAWRLTAAMRAERTKRAFARTERVPAPGRFVADQASEAWLPKIAASFAFTREANATASISLGRKPGGWSAYTDKPGLAGFRPEKAAAFEAGIDMLAAGRTLKLAARVFDYEIRDYQIERSFNATDYLVVNAPRARSSGAEVEAAWRPMAVLTLTATLGITRVTLRKFNDPFTGVSYAGRRAPYTPDYDAHFNATYRTGHGWFVAADATAVGRTFYDESENSLFASPARALVDARFGYDARRWQIVLHAENLANTRYSTLIIPGVRHEVPGAPRTYGVELAIKW